MAEQGAERDATAWLVEPPAGGQVHISFGAGEGVEVTPAVRATIERLLESLMAGEGLAEKQDPVKCGGVFQRCDTFSCKLDACNPLKIGNCFQLVSCRVDMDK